MFNRCLIMLTAVLSASCAIPAYKPSAETLGPNPATLRVIKVSSDITRSSLSIMEQEVPCKNPGETATRITSLGYTENPDFEALSQQPPYNVQIPSNQPVLIDLGFRKNL